LAVAVAAAALTGKLSPLGQGRRVAVRLVSLRKLVAFQMTRLQVLLAVMQTPAVLLVGLLMLGGAGARQVLAAMRRRHLQVARAATGKISALLFQGRHITLARARAAAVARLAGRLGMAE
jgi:hypothetical protein